MQNREREWIFIGVHSGFASPITVTMTNASFFRIAWESAVLRSVYFSVLLKPSAPWKNRIWR